MGSFTFLSQVRIVVCVEIERSHNLPHGGDSPRQPLFLIGQAGLWVVLLTALASAADYFRRFNDVLNPRIARFTGSRDRRSDRKAG